MHHTGRFTNDFSLRTKINRTKETDEKNVSTYLTLKRKPKPLLHQQLFAFALNHRILRKKKDKRKEFLF